MFIFFKFYFNFRVTNVGKIDDSIKSLHALMPFLLRIRAGNVSEIVEKLKRNIY